MKNIEQNSISINKIKNIKINKNTLKILNECNDIIYFTKIPIKSLFRKTDLITEVYQVKLQETVRNFECPICFEILIEPVQCKQCLHFFCKDCINNYFEESEKKECPFRHQFEINESPEVDIKNLIENIEFYCPFKEQGCNEIILNNDFQNHVNICDYGNFNIKFAKFRCENCKKFTGNSTEIINHILKCYSNIKNKDFKIKEYGDKTYIGQYVNEKREGFGLWINKGKNYSEGFWKNDDTDGKCTTYYEDGAIFKGIRKPSNTEHLEGSGTLTWANGEIFKGSFKDGKYSGEGSLILKGSHQFFGHFKEGKYDGFGVLYLNKGNKYIGNWKNDKRDGFGIMVTSEGSNYCGMWKEGNFYGYAGLSNKEDNTYHTIGYFENSEMKGFEIHKDDEGEYNGEGNQLEYNGIGIFFYKEGTRFEGEFENGTKNGYGVLYDSNNVAIEKGLYKNGLLIEELINDEIYVNHNDDDFDDDFINNNNNNNNDNNNNNNNDINLFENSFSSNES